MCTCMCSVADATPRDAWAFDQISVELAHNGEPNTDLIEFPTSAQLGVTTNRLMQMLFVVADNH